MDVHSRAEQARQAVYDAEMERLRAEVEVAQDDAAVAALELAAALARIAELETKPESFTTRVGVYNGSPNELPDEKTLATFGAFPEIASTYYQSDKPGLNLAYETARIKRGIAPLLTLTLKAGSVSLVDVANRAPAAEKLLGTYINALRTLSEIDPTVPVYATLDHEFEVKRNQGVINGISMETYAKALSRFLERCHAEAPQVVTLHWSGGSDKANTLIGMRALTTLPKMFAFDPYKYAHRNPTETLDVSLGEPVRWLRGLLGDVRVGLAEFGADAKFGDASNATWMQGLREWCVKNRIEFACLFNRDSSTFSYKIDAPPLTRTAFAAELAH